MNKSLKKQTALDFQKKAEDLLKTIKKRKDLPSYAAMRAIELRDKIFAAETDIGKAAAALKQLRELAEISKANNSNNQTKQ